jgi:hypothetical protein
MFPKDDKLVPDTQDAKDQVKLLLFDSYLTL